MHWFFILHAPELGCETAWAAGTLVGALWPLSRHLHVSTHSHACWLSLELWRSTAVCMLHEFQSGSCAASADYFSLRVCLKVHCTRNSNHIMAPLITDAPLLSPAAALCATLCAYASHFVHVQRSGHVWQHCRASKTHCSARNFLHSTAVALDMYLTATARRATSVFPHHCTYHSAYKCKQCSTLAVQSRNR
eukprot:10765-Heterococcus_DN1.PRE.5